MKRAHIIGSVIALAFAGATIAGPAAAHDNGAARNGGKGRPAGAPAFGHPGKGGMGGMSVYSESIRKVVTKNADGTTTTSFVTVVQQAGKVTAVTSTSVTITSENGKVLSWAIPAGNTTVFAVGDDVRAGGTKAADGTVTTTHLHTFQPRTAPAPSTTA